MADDHGRIIGVGQIKSHRDKSRELASLVVLGDYQNQGIGSAIVRDLLSYETGPIFIFCLDELAGFYERFGFSIVVRNEIPGTMARLLLMGNVMGKAYELVD